MNYISKNKFLYAIFCLLIISIALFFNLLGTLIAEHIIIPMYLDSLLSIAVTALCGLVPGILCAFISNLFLTLIYKSTFLFSICHLFTILLSWCVFKKNNKQFISSKIPIEAFLWAGLWSALSNTVIGNFIADTIMKNNTGRAQIDATVHGIYLICGNITVATYLSGFITNLIDKLLSAVISFFFYKIVKKFEEKYLYQSS